MDAKFDLLGLGCTALDELIYVETYPQPDTKTRIASREEQRRGGAPGLPGLALGERRQPLRICGL